MRGTAEVLLEDRTVDEPTVLFAELTEPTVVLGSAQSFGAVDLEAARDARISVVQRSSGGGAVLLVPGEHLWVDAIWPTRPSDERGIESSFRWAGVLFRAALASLGVEASLYEGIPDRDACARRVCFAGLGHGELSVEDTKVLGLSQRRQRRLIRVQALCLLRWRHGDLLALLSGSTDELASRLGADGELPVRPEVLREAVLDRFAAAELP
jgi:lipoate-protein ligase A